MAKRKSDFEQIVDALIEFSAMFWQVGAVLSGLLGFATIKSYLWASERVELAATSTEPLEKMLVPMVKKFYLWPIMFGLFFIIFLVITIKAYIRNKVN